MIVSQPEGTIKPPMVVSPPGELGKPKKRVFPARGEGNDQEKEGRVLMVGI